MGGVGITKRQRVIDYLHRQPRARVDTILRAIPDVGKNYLRYLLSTEELAYGGRRRQWTMKDLKQAGYLMAAGVKMRHINEAMSGKGGNATEAARFHFGTAHAFAGIRCSHCYDQDYKLFIDNPHLPELVTWLDVKVVEGGSADRPVCECQHCKRRFNSVRKAARIEWANQNKEGSKA